MPGLRPVFISVRAGVPLPDFLDIHALAALVQVVLIDLSMAGDNAVVIGVAAMQVPPAQRKKVIFGGLVTAVVLRFLLAVLAASILDTIGLMFAGGLLLLWVAWRLGRDLVHPEERPVEPEASALNGCTAGVAAKAPPGLRRAIFQIALADLSMSLDNVLAVSGAAMKHVWVLAIGLILSVALMGLAATFVAKLLARHPWINYAGLTIIVYVALRMVWFGGLAILHAL